MQNSPKETIAGSNFKLWSRSSQVSPTFLRGRKSSALKPVATRRGSRSAPTKPWWIVIGSYAGTVLSAKRCSVSRSAITASFPDHSQAYLRLDAARYWLGSVVLLGNPVTNGLSTRLLPQQSGTGCIASSLGRGGQGRHYGVRDTSLDTLSHSGRSALSWDGLIPPTLGSYSNNYRISNV